MIVRKIPNVLPKFEDMLDHATTLAEHDINDVDCELKLDFRVLIPNQSKGIYVPVISKTLEHIETFNTNYKDSS